MTAPTLPTPRFTAEEAHAAADAWRFNCGPASLCAITGLTPEQARPHLGDFERKGYTNPTMMLDALRSLGLKHAVERPPEAHPVWPKYGLARVQWGGPWCRPEVPIGARYRKTHWVASVHNPRWGVCIFDVNAMARTCDGWIDFITWSTSLVPWLLKECVPRADGSFWVTHAIEVRS